MTDDEPDVVVDEQPVEPARTPEQVAGRPLVDLTVDELADVAREVDLDGRSSMKRDELIEALGGSVDEMPDAQRVKAAAAAAGREAADAPDVDPNELAPWQRHDDVVEPMTAERLQEMIAAAQGAVTESVVDPESGERRTVTWADAEQAAAARADGRSLEQSTGSE